MILLTLTCLCSWFQSPGVRGSSDRSAQGLGWVAHTGHIPEDWLALLCTAQLTALCSSLRVSESNSRSASAASPSSFHTYCSSNRGKAGGLQTLWSTQVSLLSLTLSFSLLSPSLSLLPALCLSSSMATGNRGWRDEQKTQWVSV